MTRKERDKVIALKSGWIENNGFWFNAELAKDRPECDSQPRQEPPNYSRDLNALADVESKLNDFEYTKVLSKVIGEKRGKYRGYYECVLASADERSEAIYRMLTNTKGNTYLVQVKYTNNADVKGLKRLEIYGEIQVFATTMGEVSFIALEKGYAYARTFPGSFCDWSFSIEDIKLIP